MRTCTNCGCTDGRACLEFDAEGYAYPCFWVAEALCSACGFEEHTPADESPEVVQAMRVKVSATSRRALKVPRLAGMVARPRRPESRRRR